MRIKFTILIISFLIPVVGFGQIDEAINNSSTDSLQQLRSKLAGTEKIDALNKIAFKLCCKYPDSCISIANQTVVLLKAIHYNEES